VAIGKDLKAIGCDLRYQPAIRLERPEKEYVTLLNIACSPISIRHSCSRIKDGNVTTTSLCSLTAL